MPSGLQPPADLGLVAPPAWMPEHSPSTGETQVCPGWGMAAPAFPLDNHSTTCKAEHVSLCTDITHTDINKHRGDINIASCSDDHRHDAAFNSNYIQD